MKISFPIIFLFIFQLAFPQFTHATEPTVQASNLKIVSKTCTKITLAWIRGNGSSCLVTCRAAGQTKAVPADGSFLNASTTYGNGSNLGNQNFVISSHNVSTITINGLSYDKAYTFQVFEYDDITKDFLTSKDASITDTTGYLRVKLSHTLNDSCSRRSVVQFSADVTASFAITGMQWKIDDSLFSMGTSNKAKMIIKNAGIIPYSLKIFPGNDCPQLYVSTQSLFILPTPRVNPTYSGQPFCTNSVVKFNDSTTMENIVNTGFYRDWDFGNGQKSTISKPSMQFGTPGLKTIAVVATSLYDGKPTTCKDTAVLKILIHRTPLVDLGPDRLVHKSNTVLLKGPVGISNYAWNHVGASGSSLLVSYPTFPISKSYILKATDSTSCTDSDTIQITFDTATMNYCNAYFTQTRDSSTGYELHVKNLSVGSRYHWEFGSGDTSNNETPDYYYPKEGKYALCLTVFTSTCSSTYCDTVRFDSLTNGNFQIKVRDKDGKNVGLVSNNKLSDFKVWPNPLEKSFYVQYNLRVDEIVRFELRDLQGKLLKVLFEGFEKSGEHVANFEMPVLSKGVYILSILTSSRYSSICMLKCSE